MNPVEQYILKQKEPYQSVMLCARDIIINSIPEIDEKFSYGIPMYHYKKTPLVYLNVLKGTDFLDIAFLHGTKLIARYPDLKDYNNRKKVRSIHVHSLEKFEVERFIQILKSAIEIIENGKQ